MKRVFWILTLVSVFAFGASDAAEKAKQALDLPVAGGRAADEKEEDAPESIRFYGAEYEGDAFFWCFHAFNF